MNNKNDNNSKTSRDDLRDYAIDTTLGRLDMLENAPLTESKKEEILIGTRSLSQFLGIEDASLKRQLFEQPAMEQDFITERYIDRLRSSGSLSVAGRDLANCLTYGTDYDLKLTNMPRPQFGLSMQPPTPSMGGMGQNAGLPPGYSYNYTTQMNTTPPGYGGQNTPDTKPPPLTQEEDE